MSGSRSAETGRVRLKYTTMSWYIWTSLAALLFCVVLLGGYFLRLLKKGSPKDLSQKSGNIAQAVCYSCIGAMSPVQKESAYLHLPTYSAGIIFHIGNFLALLVYVIIAASAIFSLVIPVESVTNSVIIVPAAAILVAGICGLSLFIKRIVKKELRELSCADDYISNFLCTVMLFVSAYSLWMFQFGAVYFVTMALLFIWMPIGKIKHVLYFFFARYHLGFFYGWRGTWPPKKATV